MIRKFDDRQYSLHVMAPIGIGNIGENNGLRLAFPVGSLILSAQLWTGQEFDGTATVTVTGADDTVYANAVNVKALGSHAVTGIPKYFPNGEVLEVSAAGDSDATGEAFLVMEYIIKDRGNEVYE